MSVAYLDQSLPGFSPSFLGSVHGQERSDPKSRCWRANVLHRDGPEGSSRYLNYYFVINEPLCAPLPISMVRLFHRRLFGSVGLCLVVAELWVPLIQ